LEDSSTGYGGVFSGLNDFLDELRRRELKDRSRLKEVDFEVFLKTWRSYLQLQEDLERLRMFALDPKDQKAILDIELSLLELSKRIFRKRKAVSFPL
jgi:hypothetical protein